jgi:hypothetical protein
MIRTRSDEVRAGGTMVKISIASGYYQGARSEMSVGEIYMPACYNGSKLHDLSDPERVLNK